MSISFQMKFWLVPGTGDFTYLNETPLGTEVARRCLYYLRVATEILAVVLYFIKEHKKEFASPNAYRWAVMEEEQIFFWSYLLTSPTCSVS